MTRLTDMTGQRCGRLVVLEKALSRNGEARWLCRCDCGNAVTIFGSDLRTGHTTSCGCARREMHTVHGMIGTDEYWSWRAMRQRCTSPKDPGWQYYGGRGITVCERWNDFRNFFADMGPRPKGKTLGRINNDGNYEPSNCRWETPLEQRKSQRKPRKPWRKPTITYELRGAS